MYLNQNYQHYLFTRINCDIWLKIALSKCVKYYKGVSIMVKDEAVDLLTKCLRIAAKVATIEGDFNLSHEDQLTLSKFYEEGLIHLIYDEEIYQLAALTLDDVVNLNFLLAMEVISNLCNKQINTDQVCNLPNSIDIDTLYS